jgi:hypothetical protein
MKKLVARLATALAIAAIATPALPCGASKTTTAEVKDKKAQQQQQQVKTADAKGTQKAPPAKTVN